MFIYCDMFTHLPSEMEHPKDLQPIYLCLIERGLAHTRHLHEQYLGPRDVGKNSPDAEESRCAAPRERFIDLILEFLLILIVESSALTSVNPEMATITRIGWCHHGRDFCLQFTHSLIETNIDYKDRSTDDIVVGDEETVNY